MGEVIRGQFGGQRSGLETPEQKDQQNNSEPKRNVIEKNGLTTMQNAFLKMLEAEESGDERAQGAAMLSESAEKVEEMEEYIKSVEGRTTTRILAEAEQYWMSQPIESLYRAIMETSETDWQRDPGRYIALGKEHTNRAKRMSEFFM